MRAVVQLHDVAGSDRGRVVPRLKQVTSLSLNAVHRLNGEPARWLAGSVNFAHRVIRLL